VLDDPTWFQLLSSLDGQKFTRSSPVHSRKGKEAVVPLAGITVWDSEVLRMALSQELRQDGLSENMEKAMIPLEGEQSDVVVWHGVDGNVSLRSIAVSHKFLLLLEANETRTWIGNLQR
jgi:hypothetical protein